MEVSLKTAAAAVAEEEATKIVNLKGSDAMAAGGGKEGKIVFREKAAKALEAT